MEQQYDVIIAGTGAAGLSLAYYLSLSDKLSSMKVLLLDQEAKEKNDKTWSFWEEGIGPFDSILHRKWERVSFYGRDFHKTLQMDPYRYKMIKADAFYDWITSALKKQDNFHFAYGAIADISEAETIATVSLDDGTTIKAPWVFNSTPFGKPKPNPGKYNYLLQHFKGYEITTKQPIFDPQEPTFMDFRVPQGDANDARFGYVLPDSPTEALVEYTVFSNTLWSSEEYNSALQDYLLKHWDLSPNDYDIRRVEDGVIPMTDQYFPPSQGKRIIQMGTVGGQTKASTGYTFQRVQHHCRALIEQWETTGSPEGAVAARWNRRFSFYDAVLLEVMDQSWYNSKDIFTRIFQKNPEARVFRFLDEKTQLKEEIAIMNTMPYVPFLKAVGSKIFKYAFR